MLTFGSNRTDASPVKRLPALLAVVALAATACQAADATTVSGERDGSAVVAPYSQTSIKVSPKSGKSKVDPSKVVVVSAENGALSAVRVTGANHKVKGSIGPDGVWRSSGSSLRFATRYTVTARAVDSAGHTAMAVSTFKTVKPKAELTTSISPIAGQTVGVGMPIIVRLSAPVTNRAAVQQGLSVTTSREVVGSWSWISDHEVHWRPKTYWPADTQVSIGVQLDGVKAGGGVWGAEDRTIPFTIGSATVSTVDILKHTLTVTEGGKEVRVIPITTGKDGFITREGIKVITSKERYRVMDASTIDIPKDSPDYYRLKVEYAMRLTWSGEFLHAAPWSVANQGHDNVSHGCTGMSLEDAKWLFEQSKIGDPVKFTGSDRPLESGNGWTDWNVSWSQWKAGSAL